MLCWLSGSGFYCKLKEKPTQHVLVRCWATTSCQKSFNALWNDLIKSMNFECLIFMNSRSVVLHLTKGKKKYVSLFSLHFLSLFFFQLIGKVFMFKINGVDAIQKPWSIWYWKIWPPQRYKVLVGDLHNRNPACLDSEYK